jgi:outer membrane receptor protein involved in Fe transport
VGVLPFLVRLGFASDKPDVVEGAGAKHFRVDSGWGRKLMPEEKVMTESTGRIDSFSWARLRNSIASFFILVILILVIPRSAWAQATGSLSGTVHDATGAVVAGADVTLRDTQKGFERHTLTNDSGIYVFVSVPPDEYRLTVTKAGFRVATQEQLTLLVNQAATQDFTLIVGSSQETVTVKADAVGIESGNATLGTVIQTQQVETLPLNGRNFSQLLTLTPGVSPISTAQNSGGAQTSPIGSFTFPAVNGQSNRSNYFMLDGIDDNEMVFSTYAVAPILDDIQEFKVQSHNDEVQFGGVTGGIINVVTKSGTNQYHATAWEYLRNTVFDAENPFSGKSQLVQNQFGAAGGGPVLVPHLYDGHDKTFFYGSYEGFRRSQPSTSTFYNVPTAAQLAGDFSGLCKTGFTAGICNDRSANGAILNQLYNPFTTAAGTGGTYTRAPFLNNNISSVLNAGALAYAKDVFPAPLPLQNGFNGYDFRHEQTTVNQYSWRVDEIFNPSNSLFFRYSSANQPNVGSGGTTNFDNTTTITSKQYVASYYHTFSPVTTFDFQFGHVQLTNGSVGSFNGNTSSVISDVGFPASFACGFTVGASCLVPSVNIPNYTSVGAFTSITALTDIYEWRGNFTKTVGNQTFTFGGSFETDHFTVQSTGAGVTFASDQTADPVNSGGNTGNALASFLIGTASGGNRRDTVAAVSGQKGIGGYFMDKWKATNRLTLNLGLRYDLQLYPLYGNLKNGTSAIGEIDFNNGTYILQRPVASCAATGNIAPCIPGTTLPTNVVISPNNRLWRNTYTNFQPRLGLAYRVTNNTVVRAGFGITDDLWAGITQTVQGIGGDWPSNSQPIVALNQLGQVPSTAWQNPLAASGSATNAPAPTPFQQVAFYRDPQAKNPYSEQWNLGLERQIGANNVVTANYVGSESHRLVVGSIYNTALTPGPNLNPDGTLATTPAEIAAAFALRQQWQGISPTFYDRGIGNGTYNALQLSARGHDAQHGLTYLVSYTYSKTIDEGSDGFFGVEDTSVQNPYNIRADRSVAGYDLPHILSVSFTVDSPFGAGKRFSSSNDAVNYIVGNWQLSSIYTFTSGQPYTVTVPGDVANVNGGVSPPYNSERANLVGNPNTGSCPSPVSGGAPIPVGSVGCWFNTSAFAVPAAYTFGDTGRNPFRAGRFNNVDLTLARAFPFREKFSLLFRTDAFNLFNHPNLGVPDATVGDLNFGRVIGLRTNANMRVLQLSLRLTF